MIQDFPIDIRIRLAELKFFFVALTLLIFCPACLLSFDETANRAELGLRTHNEGINQRNLKFWTDVADKICFGRT